ncbi:MAG: molybdate ABC transporter permease subunit [Oscillospiraceae bacterium]|nr:molybdate ABC transporter permease subunit [Oscillospiraceae bacterium]
MATVVTFAAGILAAYGVLRLPRRVKGACDTILTIPMVLPPTVVGYFILVTVSPNSALGKALFTWFGITVTMRWYAAVIAVIIVTFPLMYRTVRGAFEAFDKNLIDAGKTLGKSNSYIFMRVLLPNCKQGILAGTALAFARGLGEYGATSMVAGYIANKTATISTSVAYFWQINQDDKAMLWVIINLCISFAVMIIINFFERGYGTKPKKPRQKKGGVQNAADL